MNTKTRESSAKRELAGNEQSALNMLADLGRHQLALAVESAGALYRSSEDLRKIQHETAREASAFHQDTVQRLFKPCQPDELLAIQTEFMRFSMESASKYWQQIAEKTIQAQVEMMRSVSHVMEREKDLGLRSPLEIFQAAIPPLASSFFPMNALVPEGQVLHS